MHPNLAGILAHEAVGHTVEADLVLGGSVAAHCMNKQVASELYNHGRLRSHPAGRLIHSPAGSCRR